MTPNSITASVSDTLPFQNPIIQITPYTFENEMINEMIEFLDLYHQIILNRERCEEPEELLKQASEFDQKYKISFEDLVKVKQVLVSGSGSSSGFASMPEGFADIADAMRQAEILRDVQAWKRQALPQTFQQQQDSETNTQAVMHGAGGDQSGRSDMSVVTNVRETLPIRSSASVIASILQLNRVLRSPPRNTNVGIEIQTMSPPEAAPQHLQNETETNTSRRPAPTTLNLGKSHLKIIIPLGLAVATIVYGNSRLSSSAEGVKILRAAVISSMVAFLGCVADILLHHRNKHNAAKVAERVGFAGTVFAFTTILAGCLGLKTAVVFGFAAVVTVVILMLMTML